MDLPGRLATLRADTSRLALRRRMLVAVLTGIAVICGLKAVRPPAAPTSRVWVAARDLPGGDPLSKADLRAESLPLPDVPAGALAAGTTILGRLVAAPMRRGEPVTDVRLLSPSLLSATDQPGAVAVPVRVADGPAALALVRAGDVVDVIATSDAEDGEDGGTIDGSTVVHDVRVLATPARDDVGNDSGADGGDSAGLLIVEATGQQAAILARAAGSSRLSVAVRRPS